MAIELFSIGTELVLGQIQDTNAHWFAQQILQIGGELRRVTILRDNADEMSEALESAIKRETSLILTTGGLGSTPDDMTVEVIASLIGTKPVVSEETIAEFGNAARCQRTTRSTKHSSKWQQYQKPLSSYRIQ